MKRILFSSFALVALNVSFILTIKYLDETASLCLASCLYGILSFGLLQFLINSIIIHLISVFDQKLNAKFNSHETIFHYSSKKVIESDFSKGN